MTIARTDAAAAPGPAWGRRVVRLAEQMRGLRPWRRFGLAMVLGSLSVLTLPPVSAAPLLFVTLPLLIWLLDGTGSRGGAFAVGWGFGFGYFVFGFYWIAFALTVDLARFWWVMPFAIAGLPAGLAILWGAVATAWRALPWRGPDRIFGFALLMGTMEWVRGHALTGFPWNLPGYVWVEWQPVLQIASVIGLYGLTFLTLLIAAAPAAMVARDGRMSRRPAVLPALALAVLLGMTAWGLQRVPATPSPSVPDVRLRLVQANIPQVEKWDPGFARRNFERQRQLSVAEGFPAVTHVIWPETAVPYDVVGQPVVQELLGQVTPPGGMMLVGAPRFGGTDTEPAYWNSLLALDDTGTVQATFDKFHLVPFGEYVPDWAWFLTAVGADVSGAGSYSAGEGPVTLELPGLPPVSPLICYEVIFPAQVTGDGPRPGWLLNITNDAWYGETAGPHQHFAIARARAVEEGLPLVRVAATGISGVIDPFGRVTGKLDLGSQGVLDADLPQALVQPTPYARHGDLWLWAMLALTGIAAVLWPIAGRR